MDEYKEYMNENLFKLVKRLEELKVAEYKYEILTEYIKSEANEIYFDKIKLLRMIDILDGKKIEEIMQEKNKDE